MIRYNVLRAINDRHAPVNSVCLSKVTTESIAQRHCIDLKWEIFLFGWIFDLFNILSGFFRDSKKEVDQVVRFRVFYLQSIINKPINSISLS